MELEQLDLWGLFPEIARARDLEASRPGFFAEIGSSGGCETVRRYGKEHMRRIASDGGKAAKRRRHTQPRTITYQELGDLVMERLIPYWPHQPRRRRRKRPIKVRIEQQRVKVFTWSIALVLQPDTIRDLQDKTP